MPMEIPSDKKAREEREKNEKNVTTFKEAAVAFDERVDKEIENMGLKFKPRAGRETPIVELGRPIVELGRAIVDDAQEFKSLDEEIIAGIDEVKKIIPILDGVEPGEIISYEQALDRAKKEIELLILERNQKAKKIRELATANDSLEKLLQISYNKNDQVRAKLDELRNSLKR